MESSSHGYSLVTPRSGHRGASACLSACLIYSKCNIKDSLPFGGCMLVSVYSLHIIYIYLSVCVSACVFHIKIYFI